MDNNHRSLKVFLCHSHADRNSVCALYNRLTKDGVDAWWDKEKLMPGQAWEFEIQKAVREADVVVVCLSKHFNQAGFRQKEVQLALETAMKKPAGEIFIIPARLEECETLEALEKWQWVDLFEANGYERLMRALRARADKLSITLRKNRLSITSPYKRDELIRAKKQADLRPQPPNNDGATSANEPTPLEPTPQPKRNGATRVAVIGLVVIFIAAILISPAIGSWLSSANANFTPTVESVSTQSPSVPFMTSTSQATVPPSTSTSRSIGSDGMPFILIPAGEFQMGSTGTTPDERPVHPVYLDAYFIDQTEVTNFMYALCVEQGKCEPPRTDKSITQNKSIDGFYYGNPEFDNYPVIYVSWNDAKAYCESVSRRLPTEAEWEKAASWDDIQGIKRIYPWGNSIDCSYANFYNQRTLCVGDTSPVGYYQKGASFYGVLDMAGNVWEWVADRYDPEYYGKSPEQNPEGPESGNYMVIRGGSFLIGAATGIRSSDRDKLLPDNTSHNVGFRCAMSATP
ncbi:MAG: TIR domain-containing protein [Chloroflexi bacterium]|nr:MAG: TIR domain-containing protein [Chloroflexota bacterium]